MRFVVARNPVQVSDAAFELFSRQLARKPSSVFLLASGSTPLGLYHRIVKAVHAGKLDVSKAVFIGLDEYVGLKENYAQSFHFFFHHHLFSKLNVSKKNIFLFNPNAPDEKREISKMTKILKGHPVDVAILGLGQNGHVAFNEPGSMLNSSIRLVSLSEKTRLDNARSFGSLEEVPKKAITLGLSEVLNAKKIVLLACGTEKASAIHAMLDKPVSTSCPASVLSNHRDCVVIADSLAASKTNFPRLGVEAGSVQLGNIFNLPSHKKICVLAGRLPDVSMYCGAVVKSLSAQNAVVLLAAEPLPGQHDRKLMDSEALQNASSLGCRCVLVHSGKTVFSKSAKAEAVKISRALNVIRPDIVIIPNRFHSNPMDLLVRKAALDFSKKNKHCGIWSFESDRGLFEAGSFNFVFEFGVGVMLRKFLAIRKLRSLLRSSRIDLAAKSFSVFRRISVADQLSLETLLPVHMSKFVELVSIERSGDSGR